MLDELLYLEEDAVDDELKKVLEAEEYLGVS